MPIGGFEPIIGSSFDAIAGQRQSLLGLDATIQAQNLARAAQAQRDQQNWLAQVADMHERAQQEDLNRQLSADQTSRALAFSLADRRDRADEWQQQFKEGQKEFADTQKQREDQFKQSLAYGREQVEQQKKNKEFNVDQRGAALAQHYAIARSDSEKAQSDLETAQNKVDTLRAKVDADLKLPSGKQNIMQRTAWLNEIRDLERNIPGLQKMARAAENLLMTLPLKRDYQDFEISDDGTITHPESTRTWSWKKALKAAQVNTTQLGPPAPPPQADAAPGTPWGQIASTLGRAALVGASPIGSVWGGFTRGTGTTPPPQPPSMPAIQPANINPLPVGPAPTPSSPPTPMRVGQYMVTPMDGGTQPQRAQPVQVGRYTATPIEE